MTFLVVVAVLQAAVPADTVVARVAGEGITAGEVSGRMMPAGPAPSVIEAVDQLVSEATLARAARAEKVPLGAAAKERLAAERRKLSVGRLFEKEVFAGVSVSDAQLKTLFHAANDEVRLALVVRKTKEEAQGVLERLSKGGSLAQEAKSSTDSMSRERGGDLPWAKRGELPADLAAAAFAAPVGKPSGPVASGGDWAVLVVRDRKIADEAEMEPIKEQVRAVAQGNARDEAENRFMDGIRRAKGARVEGATLAAVAARAKPAPADLKKVAASAGTIRITVGEVVKEAAGAGPKGGAGMYEAIAGRLLDRKLVEAAAAERGYTKDAKVEAGVRALERALLADAYREKLRKSVAGPTPAELEARYKEKPADFVIPVRRKCWQVVSKSEDASKKVRARLAGGEPFEAVAKESVNAPTAAKGGLIGEITDPQLEDIAKAGKDGEVASTIRGLGAGQLSAPVKDSAGDWHVFKCEAPLPSRTRPLDEVRTELSQTMKAERARAAVTARVAALRKDAAVTMDDGALAQLTAARKPPKDAMHGGGGGHGGH